MVKMSDAPGKRIVPPAALVNEVESLSPEEFVKQAVSGNRKAIRDLISWLTPVIQSAAAHTLCRFSFSQQDFRAYTEVADYCQDVFMHLFENECRVLVRWDPSKGMSLTSFVGLITKRRVISSLRGTLNFQRLDTEAINKKIDKYLSEPDEENRFAAQHFLFRIVDTLRATISDVGYDIFVQIFLYEMSVDEVANKTGISKNAIYVWKNRLRNQAKEISSKLENCESSESAINGKTKTKIKKEVALNE